MHLKSFIPKRWVRLFLLTLVAASPQFGLAACNNSGPQRIAVIVADYQGSPSLVSDLTYIKELFLGKPGVPAGSVSIANFFKTISMGRASIDDVTFLGPYHLDHAVLYDSQGATNPATIMEGYKLELMALAERDVNLKNIDRVVFFTPGPTDIRTGKEYGMGAGAASNFCDFFYAGNSPRKGFGKAWIHTTHRHQGIVTSELSTHWDQYSAAQQAKMILQRKLEDMEPIAHEIGHTFGLGHANRMLRRSVMNFPHAFDEVLPDVDVPLFELNYGDVASFMGSAAMGWPNIVHRAELGWIDPASVKIVNTAGSFRVFANQTAGKSLTGLRIQRLKHMNEHTNAELWLEYRQLKSQYDIPPILTQMKTDGALVYYVNPDQVVPDGWNFPNQTVLINFQPPGSVEPAFPTDFTLKSEWKDPHSLVGLHVLNVTPEYLDVRISYTE